jgi:hypothetical protein
MNVIDWETFVHPARAYERPADVIAHQDLTVWEKRAILSLWASDACAVPSEPALKHPPQLAKPVTFDEVYEALRSLDDPTPPKPRGGAAKRPPRTRGGDYGPLDLAA